MGLQRIDNAVLEKYRKTLKECSKRDSGEPVTLSEYEAYQFDDLSALEAEKYRRKKKLCSADALYIKNKNEIYFFEFKDARKSNLPWKSIQEKAHDSLIPLQVLLFPEMSVSECAKKVSFFVIYNEKAVKDKENDSKSFAQFKSSMGHLAQKRHTYPVLGNMNIYENTFYKKVYTIDVSDFEKDFLDKIYH